MTECNGNTLHFQRHGRRHVVVQFDGGMITSDAGGLLLREVNETFGVIRQFAACFRDHRERRVIGKAEQLSQGANPRFVVW